MIINFTVSIITPEPEKGDIQEDLDLLEQLEDLRICFGEGVIKSCFKLNEAFWEIKS